MNNAAAKPFGATLADARAPKGLSLGDTAKSLGVAKSSLWRWENNETKVDAQRLVDIASSHGMWISEIFDEKTLKGPTQTDFDRLGGVVEVLRLVTSRVLETPGRKFDPSRYDAMVSGMLGKAL